MATALDGSPLGQPGGDAAPRCRDGRPLRLELTEGERRTVLSVLSRCLPTARVWVFGSRATGCARPFSDLDLLVLADQPVGWAEHAALRDAFEASALPFRVDIVDAWALPPGMRDRVDAEKLLLVPG